MTTPRILIVDDQRDILRLIHATLDTLGHKLEIIEAPSGEEALLEASRAKIDLLVTDYRLPGITGVELMEKVRGQNPDVRTVLITGMTDRQSREEMLAAGAAALFDKPIALADFLDVVERSLGLKRTILPPEAGDEAGPGQQGTLADLLAQFRQHVKARAVFLVSDRGRVLVRAGDLPDSSMEVSLLSALVAIHNASQKVARFVHQETPQGLHVFQGGDQDLILVPVNPANALLVTGDDIASDKRFGEVLRATEAFRSNIAKILRSIGAPTQSVTAEAEKERAQEELEAAPAEDLEKLFAETKARQLKPDEINSFWDQALEKQEPYLADPDKLSFDQAQRLGLTPGQDKKKK